jgi:hypothetical protein
MVEASFFSEGRRQFSFDVPALEWPALAESNKADSARKSSGTSKVEVFCVKTDVETNCFTDLKSCELEALGQTDSTGAAVHCTSWAKPPCKLEEDGVAAGTTSCGVRHRRKVFGGAAEVVE